MRKVLYRSLSNKKGAIALSVSAIVILILAIVILGLGLGFIRGMFGRVSVQIEEQVSAEPEPPNPSSSNAITLSRESILTYAGEKEVIKVAAFNPSNETWPDAIPIVTCTNLVTTAQNVNEKTIDQGSFETFTVVLTIPKNSVPDTHLCKMGLCQVNTTSPTSACDNNPGYNSTLRYLKDLNIKISE